MPYPTPILLRENYHKRHTDFSTKCMHKQATGPDQCVHRLTQISIIVPIISLTVRGVSNVSLSSKNVPEMQRAPERAHVMYIAYTQEADTCTQKKESIVLPGQCF